MKVNLVRSASLFFATVGMTGIVAAAEISFTGRAGAELTAPDNWEGGACPGETDVAVISNVGGANLTLANNLKIAGLKVTADAALMTIEPVDPESGTLPRLQLGGEGVILKTAQSRVYGLVLKVPVEILAEQEWDLGSQILQTYQPFAGDAKLTFKNASVIDHYAAPRYAGELAYRIPNLDYDQRVNLREEAKWARKVSSPDGNFRIGPVVPDGEKWQWSKIFPSGTRFSEMPWMVTGWLLNGAGSTSEMTVDEEATSTIDCSGATSTFFGPGVFNLTGGNLTSGNEGRLIGTTTFRMSDGVFSSSRDGFFGVMGMDIVQDEAEQVFDQCGGTVNSWGLMIGGVYGNWEMTKNGFGQYVLGEGTLNVQTSAGWNSFGGGLCLSAKGHMRGDDACAPGVFTQTGGVANVDFVRFGVENNGTSYENTRGFGLLDLAGGRFNLGSSGILLGSSWNYSTAAGYASNACYRVRLSGGTFAPSETVVKAQMDLPPSDTPVVFEPQRDMIVQAPVWGEGTLRKTGPKTLVLTDIARFTGELSADEGTLVIASESADPDAETCIKWTGDSAAASGYKDGEAVERWSEANNDGARTAVAYTAKAGCYQPPCPTLAENAFGSHAGVRFKGSAMEISTDVNPVAGQTNWTIVVVFKTKQAGGCSLENDYNWCYTPGLLGNSATGWQDDSWGLSAGNSPVTDSLVFGVGYDGNGAYAPLQSVRGDRADDRVHVVVCTQSAGDQVSTINLDGIMSTCTGDMRGPGAHARRMAPCYLGFHSAAAESVTTAEAFAFESFDGTFAEIRFYQDRVLSVDEQNALIRALAEKYGDSPAVRVGSAVPTPSLAFDADTIVGADGMSVESWDATTGSGAFTREQGGGRSAPVLVKGAFAEHNALRFDMAKQSALGLARDSIPWLGRKNLGAAIVFRTKTDGLDDQHDTYGNTIQGRGLLSTSGKEKNSVNGFSLSFRKCGTVAACCQTVDLNDTNHRVQVIHTKKPCLLNDGAVHVAVATYDETAGKFRLMIDGYYTETSYAATKVQDSPQNLLIGSLCKDADKYFTGEIAEVKLFGSALSRSEMQALTDDWAEKYKFHPLAGALFANLSQVSGTGISASRIRVAENGTLAMSSATLGAGQELSVAGTLRGDLMLTDGAILKATVGVLGEISSLSVSGTVTLDVSGLPRDLSNWTPLYKVGVYNEREASWRLCGTNVNPSLSVEFRNGELGVRARKGFLLIVK